MSEMEDSKEFINRNIGFVSMFCVRHDNLKYAWIKGKNTTLYDKKNIALRWESKGNCGCYKRYS